MSEFDYIEKNINDIREKINKAVLNRDNKDNNSYTGCKNKKVRLMAVTKTVDVDRINFAISKGVDLIGENKVTELLEKYDRLNKDRLEIHFIGNLQTNKVRYIIDKVNLIQSVNSLKLAEEINKRANQKNIVMDILVEINIGEEDSKIGIAPENAVEFMNSLKDFQNIRVKGIMTIPPAIASFGENSKIKKYFSEMYKIFVDIAEKKIDNINMDILSMGMSEDYEEAVLCGSDIVRVGRAIFGERKLFN
ncbi:MAG: YggS family pyridoxal phosphate-dependent enzyme [Oscillospiraceae bacterium]|nr:YggS family pyridoxal phosphate-dependent enzyme [Oscillospiraceae bacterium]